MEDSHFMHRYLLVCWRLCDNVQYSNDKPWHTWRQNKADFWNETSEIGKLNCTCFYWLRQLRRRIGRSLERIEHAFKPLITSHVDYCNVMLAGAPKSATDELKRVLKAAIWIVNGTRKLDRGLSRLIIICTGSTYQRERERERESSVTYKLGVYRCLLHKAHQYLADCCRLASDVATLSASTFFQLLSRCTASQTHYRPTVVYSTVYSRSLCTL